MAVLDNIRKRTGLMLIVVLGATAAFVLGDLISGAGNSAKQSVGEINGEKIDSQLFNQLSSKYKKTGRFSDDQAEGYAWNDMLFEYGWKEQIEKAGIAVSRFNDEDEESEEFDMIQGKTLFKDFFGENRENLPHNEFVTKFNSIIANIMDAGEENATYKVLTDNKETYYNSRLRDKYTALFTQSAYVTTAQARRKTQSEGADAIKASFEYVYTPFTSIVDSTIEVTDSELETYISAHEKEFDVQDGRDIKYVALSYKASPTDAQELLKKALSLKQELLVSTKDQEFVNTNAETQSSVALAAFSALPAQVKADSTGLAKGKVYGPFFVNNKYETYKISDIRYGKGVSKTSVSVITVDTSRIATDKVGAALDSAATLLSKAQGDSASVASLQWQPLGEVETTDTVRFPQSILDAIFASSKKGVHSELVSFPQGVMIVKRDAKVERADTKYAIAKIDLALVPSQITRDSVWDIASQLIGGASSLEELEALVKEKEGITIETAQKVDKNSPYLNRYSGSDAKSIISWAYKNKVGEFSNEIYDLLKQETYIIAAVAGATEKGKITVDAVRNEATQKVRNEKKAAQLIALFDGQKTKGLAEIAQELNKTKTPNFATYNTVSNLTSGAKYIPNFNYGYDAVLAGTAFGITKGETSPVLVGEKGVFILKSTATTEAVSKKDYTQEKKTMAGATQKAQANKLNTVFSELIEIEDTRYMRR